MKNSEPFWFDPLNTLLALLIGAILTFISTHHFELKKEKAEKKARAFELVFALNKIANDLIQLNNSIQAAVSAHEGTDAEAWQFLPIHAGWDDPVEVSSAQLSVVAMAKENELTTKVQEAVSAHRIYTMLTKRFSELLQQLADAGLASSANGNVISFSMTEQQYAQVVPLIVQLRTIADKLVTDLPNAVEEIRNVCLELPPKLKTAYKLDHIIGLTFEENPPS